MRRIVWGLCLCLCSLLTFAQQADYQVKGSLKDVQTGEVINFADVLLYKTGNSQSPLLSFPDDKGEFLFKEVPDGTYTLMVRLMGYDIFSSKPLEVTAGAKHDLGVISMHPLEIGLAEVEVVAEKRQLVYKLDKKVVDASSNLLGSAGSAVDILENTPSIRVDAEGEVTFRGSAGFLVYVDGKPSVFKGTQALEQVPAGQIENIEIITTPSAKHDTDGDVGIINIITKKHFLKGLSGMVAVSGNTWETRRADFLLNMQYQRSHWFLGGQWSDKLTRSKNLQEITTYEPDRTITLNTDGPQKGKRFNHSLKAGWGMEWEKTTLEISAEGGEGGRYHNADVVYDETQTHNGEEMVRRSHRNVNAFENTEKFGLGNLALAHHFDENGHQLAASFYYKYGGDALESSRNELYDGQGKLTDGMCYYESEYRETIRGNLDYVLPLGSKGKLEAGYQYSSYLEDGDFSMEWLNTESGKFENQEDKFNTFHFREELNSVYALLSGGWKNLEAQVGVRGEHTNTRLISSIPGASISDKRFEVFPSVHAGYNFPHDQRVLFSYSYRTTRPQLWFMEPYLTYNDFYSAVIGNPKIKPEYIHSFEVNYRKIFGKNTLSATLFHRSRKDKVERLRVPFENGVTLDSMANVGNDYSTGLELSVSLHPIKKWNMTVNGNVYHYRVNNELDIRGGKDESSTNYDILWNNLFTLGKYTRLQVDGSFVGPSVTTQGKRDAYWYANIAVRQQFLNRRLTATLAARDVFRSACYVNDVQTPDLHLYNRVKPKYPQVMLTVSYTFNNFKGKAAKEKENRNDMFEGKR